eukprot:Seg10943.1 transcript_id=Seg10943.1/GoldUCD/mRNA.D3Y31 product="hypothetical protein" protein_id=Seg10943.1/GoldUCD/D3Y31
MKVILTLAFVALHLSGVLSYFVNIDAHGEECFHDRVPPGTKMALMFEVADGGFLDIDVKVRPGRYHSSILLELKSC